MSRTKTTYTDYEISSSKIQHCIPFHSNIPGGNGISSFTIKKNDFFSKFIRIKLCRGIELCVEYAESERDFNMLHTMKSLDNGSVATVVFYGNHSNKLPDCKFNLDFRNKITWNNLPGERYTSFFKGGIKTLACHICFKKRMLDTYPFFHENGKNNNIDIISGRSKGYFFTEAVVPELRSFIVSLYSLKINSPWDWIAFEGRVLGISSKLFESYLAGSNGKNVLQPEETDKIIFAKEILEYRFDSPPPLSELAKITGLNEFKLKKGFKELYNNSVYNYIKDYRLEVASHKLEKGEMSLKEIASYIGYSNLQSFSKAFTGKYGISPGGYRKKIY